MEPHSYAELFLTLVVSMSGMILGVALGCVAVMATLIAGAAIVDWVIKKVRK